MSIENSPPSFAGNDSVRIDRLERAVGAIEREANGMRRENVKDANGQVWEVLARRGPIEPVDLRTPFRLSVSGSNGAFKFTVSKELSTITDGTNGDMADLTTAGLGEEKAVTQTSNIVLRAELDANLVPTYWYLDATQEKDEVVLQNGSQTEVRLLIGKIIINGNDAEAVQGIFTAQRLTHGFLNGVLVRVFESAPVHPDYQPPTD